MIYHILTASGYMDRYIQFMRQNRSQIIEEHCFAFFTQASYQGFNTSDCKNIKGFWRMLKLFLFSGKKDRFILHSYMHPWLYLVCFLVFWKLKKFTWSIWGGDLYFYNEPKSLKYKLYEYLRRHTIKNFGYVLGVKGDYDLAKKYYKIKGQYLEGIYPLQFKENIGNDVAECRDVINILVGNSADPSNNHMEILRLLRRFKNDNVRLYLPLSYGGTPEYIYQVDQVGAELFGDKYVSMKEFMDIKQYNEFLSMMNVFVCNHERQQALGNIFALLYLGKKVYIRNGITTVDLFNDYGLKFFFIHDIAEMTLNDFSYFNSEDKRINHEILKNIYSSSHLISVWNNVFQKMKSV